MVVIGLTEFLIFTTILSSPIDAQGAATMMLEKHEVCGDIPNEILFFLTPRDFQRGRQAAVVNFSIPYPLSDNVLVKIRLEQGSPFAQNSWIHLVDLDVKEGFCVAIDKFAGEFIYNLERAVGIIPKTCPVPKGVYHANNFVMDFYNLRLPVMPRGRTKIIVTLLHKQKKKMVSCNVFVMSSL